MPNRILKESIVTSDTINELTPEEEVFFYRLLVVCDDYGRMDARPSILRAKCYPLRIDSVKEEDIKTWLNKLVKVGLIRLYIGSDGKQYLQVVTWDKHQQVRAKKSKYPEPVAYLSENEIHEQTNDVCVSSDCMQLQSNDTDLQTEITQPQADNLDLQSDDINCYQMNAYVPENPNPNPNPNTNTNPNSSIEIYSQQDEPVDTRTQMPTPYKQIVDLYNSICISMPRVEQLTDKRKKHIRVLWTNLGRDIAKIQELFEKAEASDFLSGRSGKWTGCNFDWLIIYNNAVKVLEGAYDNRASPLNHNCNQIEVKGDRFKDDEYAEFYE